jgi:hypothetical protein
MKKALDGKLCHWHNDNFYGLQQKIYNRLPMHKIFIAASEKSIEDGVELPVMSCLGAFFIAKSQLFDFNFFEYKKFHDSL